MKRKERYLLVAMTLLLFFAFFHPVQCEENVKPKETIRIAMFINYHPAYGSWVAKIVVLEFEDVEGLPIQINSPAFSDGFIEATILRVAYGAEGDAIRLVMEYDLSVDKEIANEYTSMVSDEVMGIINKTGALTYWRGTRIDNTTNALVIAIDRGPFLRTLSWLESLLKYRPKVGFASLITKKLLQKAYPGGQLSLGELKYTLQRTSNGYRWNFKISFSFDTDLKDEEWVETLDLNSLLLNDGLVQPSILRTSEIIVQTLKKHNIPLGIYEASFESVYPSGSVQEEDNWIYITYQLTAPIDNVVATVKVSKLKPSLPWDRIIAIVLVIAVSVVIVTLYLKKRRGGEKA